MLTPSPRDDTERLFADLRSGLPVRVLAAPVAVRRIPRFGRFLGYLRSLGALSFHAVLPSADIVTWMYYRLILRSASPLIASACAGVTSGLRARGHDSLRFMPPVPSPLVCAAIYLRKYRSYDEPLAFLSPCALKWTEFSPGGAELVRYNATIRGVMSALESDGIDLAEYPELALDDAACGLTVGAFGEVGAALSEALPGFRYRSARGFSRALSELADPEIFPGRDDSALDLFEPYACLSGCDGGSGVGEPSGAGRDHCADCPGRLGLPLPGPSAPLPTRAELLALFERLDAELAPEDFTLAP